MTNEHPRPTGPRPTGNKYSVGSAEDVAFAVQVNDALHTLGVKVNPAEVTLPDGTVEYRLIAESGSKRHTLMSSLPFRKRADAVSKVVEDVQKWLFGAGASSDGLIGKRWGVATSELTVVVKENASGSPFLALEPGGIYLSFGHWVSIDEAHDVARRLREVFAAGALGSCSRMPSCNGAVYELHSSDVYADRR